MVVRVLVHSTTVMLWAISTASFVEEDSSINARLHVCADEAACVHAAEAADEALQVEMLQQHHSISSDERMVAQPMQLPQHITWFHVPRTGSSFWYTLRFLPSLCDDYEFCLSNGPCSRALPTMGQIWENCPGIVMPSKCRSSHTFTNCAEQTFGGDLADGTLNSKLVGFFRQPEQRLLSDYGWACDGGKDSSLDQSSASDVDCELSTFAVMRQGCTVKMLTYPELGGHCKKSHPAEPTSEDLEKAKTIVRNEFVFVGLTEEWDLSICLFNAMFAGSKCHRNQFKVSGSTVNTTQSDYDVSPLNGWVDKYDRELYDLATNIFQSNLRRFDVTTEKCVPCYASLP